MSATSPDAPLSYYGKPIVKEPTWKPEIPRYFFFGGLAGASMSLLSGARATGNAPLARSAKIAATLGVSVSPYFLVKDLGRPLRFYNMLRVFKVTSPMSVGTWVLSTAGTATGVATATELLGILPRVQRAAENVAGALGPPLATYTGGLIAQSVVPVWHEARQELPAIFGASAAAAAGGAAAILTPPAHARPARRLGVAGALAEVALFKAMEKRLGELVAEPYRKGEAGRYEKLATGLLAGGAALTAVAGRSRLGAAVGGALLLAGSYCGRFAVFHAGKASAADPTYTSLPQKTRAAEHGEPAVTRFTSPATR